MAESPPRVAEVPPVPTVPPVALSCSEPPVADGAGSSGAFEKASPLHPTRSTAMHRNERVMHLSVPRATAVSSEHASSFLEGGTAYWYDVQAPGLSTERYAPLALLVTINQTGKPAGVPGRARDDLATGTLVTLSATGVTGDISWVLADAPPNEAMTVKSNATLSASTGSSVTTTPDNDGTYRGTCTGGGETATFSFYAGAALSSDPTQLPQREPAFGETTEHNVPDALDPFGNANGWERTLRRWFKVIKWVRSRFLDKNGDTMAGPLDMGGNEVTNAADGSEPTSLATVGQLIAAVGGAIPSVVGLAGLKALTSASSPLVRETTVGALWIQRAAGTATADDVTVVTVTDSSCQYFRLQGTEPHATYLDQTDWYVSSSGNDWNTGTSSGSPLASFPELVRRLGGTRASLPQSVTIHVLTDMMDPVKGTLDLQVVFTVDNATLTIIVTPVSSIADVVASWSALTHGTPGNTDAKPSILTLTTNTTGSYTRKRLRFPISGQNPAYAVAGTSNPSWGGTGTKSMSCTVPYSLASAGGTLYPAAHTPVAADVVYVETLASVYQMNVSVYGNSNNDMLAVPLLVVDGLHSPNVCHFESPNGPMFIVGYLLEQTADFGTAEENFIGLVAGSPRQIGLLRRGWMWGTYFGNAFSYGGATSYTRAFWFDTLCEAAGIEFDNGLFAIANSLQVFGSSKPGLSILDGAYVYVIPGGNGGVSGNVTANVGLRIYANGQLHFWKDGSGNPALWNLHGSPGDVLFPSRTSALGTVTMTCAQALPYCDGAYSGVATLVAPRVPGTGAVAAVTVPYFDPSSQRITFSRNTLGGVIGELSAPSSLRTTTGWSFVSMSDDDRSTIDWSLTPVGQNTFISLDHQ